MTYDETRELVMRFYPAFDHGDASVADGILTDDWQDIPSAKGRRTGREGYADMIAQLRHFMPDSSIEIQNVIIDGDRVAVHSQIHGTPRGEILGLRFEGNPVSMMTVDVHAIVDGKIATTWHVEDRFGLIRQFGMPHPAPREIETDADR
jgi:steroid delta-isomerase-like uncharacterized protein